MTVQRILPAFAAACIIRGMSCLAGPGGSLALTSDYVYHGISQTCGHPAIQADLHWSSADGRAASEAFVGAWGSAGVEQSGCGAAREINLYAGYGLAVGSQSRASLTYTHYAYPGGSFFTPPPFTGHRYDYDAFEAAWAWQDQVFLSVAWTPDALRYEEYRPPPSDRSALSYGLQLRRPLLAGIALSAGVGYDQITDPAATGYGFYDLGLGYGWRSLGVQASFFRTATRAERLFGASVAGGRVALSAVWRF